MDSNKEFFLIEFKVKGALRIPKTMYDNIYKKSISGKIANRALKTAPGWAEIIYMNSFDNAEVNPREFILAWLFSTLKGHHDIAYVYARNAMKRFGIDPFWNKLNNYSEKKLKWIVFNPESMVRLLRIGYNKYFH